MPIFKLDDLAEKEVIPGYRARFIHTENVTLAYWRIQAGMPLSRHSHPHEQVVNLIEGRYEFVIEGRATVLEPGMVVVVPPNVEHGGRSLADCRIVDAFYPVREDYR